MYLPGRALDDLCNIYIQSVKAFRLQNDINSTPYLWENYSEQVFKVGVNKGGHSLSAGYNKYIESPAVYDILVGRKLINIPMAFYW